MVFLGGAGGAREIVRSRTAESFSQDPFLYYILYIDQSGFHYIMLRTIANGAPDPRCPGKTCVMFKFRQLDDLFHTLKTVKDLRHLVHHGSTEQWVWCLIHMWSMLHVISVICYLMIICV